jgi:hypothetical protein
LHEKKVYTFRGGILIYLRLTGNTMTKGVNPSPKVIYDI